ncbi:MAG: hypothetical protein P4L86_28360, partial [Mycobacterium sp.]|nr:hypothetical protein [Mycobacterium sp.]
MAVTVSMATTLVLRFADVGADTYTSLRVIGARDRMVTWVVAEDHLRAVTSALAEALPDPLPGEHLSDALARSLATGPFATPEREFVPSRRFRAEVLLSPVNIWWRYCHLLSDYVARCSAVLRHG